jgi:hypothetical protein
MRNTSRKFSVGLLVLFVLVSIVSLVILLSKKLTTNQLPRPQRNNNPFALIQQTPSNWVGLAGTDDSAVPKGFLRFDSPVNGVRAGFINLWNAYFSKGLRSIGAIAHKYLSGADIQTIEAWERGVAQFSRYGVDQQLTWPQAFDLGRAIERFENGSQWVDIADFTKGYNMATQYSNAR